MTKQTLFLKKSIKIRHERGVRFTDPESAACADLRQKTALLTASPLKTLNLGVPFTVKQREKKFPAEFPARCGCVACAANFNFAAERGEAVAHRRPCLIGKEKDVFLKLGTCAP